MSPPKDSLPVVFNDKAVGSIKAFIAQASD
jgi:hypothetical protein